MIARLAMSAALLAIATGARGGLHRVHLVEDVRRQPFNPMEFLLHRP